jgi:RNA polymerase sigma-70 factor, ECF subfamily
MIDKPDSQAILARIRAGEKNACEDCVRQYAPGVYRLALRLMRDEADAEDVMQETFLNAFKGIDKFDGRSELRTWLYRIAYNAALGKLRRFRPEFVSVDEASDPEDGSVIPPQLFDWSGIPYDELAKTELRQELEKAIGDLPEKLKSVFILRELEDLPTLETGEALGISEDLVKTRLHRARMKLREGLSSYLASANSGGRAKP